MSLPEHLTPAYRAPKLAALAAGCNNGACNVGALIKSFGEITKELQPFEAQYHPAVRYIVGHLSFLLSESSGPSIKACDEYVSWRDATVPAAPTEVTV